jgi:hypothetical protein
MRSFVIAATLMAGAGALFASVPASATPGQAVKGATAAPQAYVQQVDFIDRAERRLRRNGYTVIPPAPPPPPGAGPVIVGEAPVAPVAPGAPVVPLRPTTCGEYHYWNGVACVDARYVDEE